MKAVIAASVLVFALAQAGMAGASDPASQKLEPDVRITLPKGFKLKAYPMPIPGASNYRIEARKMRAAITGIPLEGESAAPRSDDALNELTLEGAAQYRSAASNPDAVPSLLKGEGWTTSYVTYSAKADAGGFVPFRGEAFECVSTGQVMTARTVFIVTAGSPDCEGADHQGFLKALETLSVEG
ncbi:hypothetical protein H1235_15680 [Pseudoxanthomonas sp. NC8]|nr:hypothetical protein H1235_15680 [Pseudoxanthomonas sp. NC8]